MIRHIFYTTTQSIFPRNEKKKKRISMVHSTITNRSTLQRFFSRNFSSIFDTTSRCDQSRKKFQIISNFGRNLSSFRRRKKSGRYGRKALINHRFFLSFPDCRHLRVHARVRFQNAATTIIDGERRTIIHDRNCIGARRGEIRTESWKVCNCAAIRAYI